MTTPYRVDISEPQLLKLKRCGKKKKACKINLNLRASANHVLKLSPVQIASIENARRQRKGVYSLALTGTQVGGFLPLLLPALAAIGKAAGLGMAGYLGSKVAQKVIGQGLTKIGRKRKKKGVKKKKKKGVKKARDIFLPGTKQRGYGVYLPGTRRN